MRTVATVLFAAAACTGADPSARLPIAIEALLKATAPDATRTVSTFIEIAGSNSDLEVETRLGLRDLGIAESKDDAVTESRIIYKNPSKFRSEWLNCVALVFPELRGCSWTTVRNEGDDAVFYRFCRNEPTYVDVIYDLVDKKVGDVRSKATDLVAECVRLRRETRDIHPGTQK